MDVQVVLKGGERIRIYNPEGLKIATEYSEETDCQFYKAKDAADMEFKLFPGKMAVFFPQDIHGCQFTQSNEMETIKKIVIKISFFITWSIIALEKYYRIFQKIRLFKFTH